MSSDLEPQLLPIPTFSSRHAPRPRVVPLYATTVPRHSRLIPSIHQDLRPTALYHPYAQVGHDKPAPIMVSLSSSSSSSSTNSKESCVPLPVSPLTPISDGIPEDVRGPSQMAHSILIPPPHARVTVKNSGWLLEQQQQYRVCLSLLRSKPY